MPEIQLDAWSCWRELTAARIALGRAGGSLPTREWLEFSLAHARARDAVHIGLDGELLAAEFAKRGWESIIVSSLARDRVEMLQQPHLGRKLRDDDLPRLQKVAAQEAPYDLSVLIGDGLSAVAAQSHAAGLLEVLLPKLSRQNWRIAPLVIAHQARVALQDEVGRILNTRLILSLVGERPGLGAADSLGAYFVHEPMPGRHDAERNCVSNIRPAGLPLAAAAETLAYLLTAAHTRRLSGVQLKDDRTLLATSSSSDHLA